MTPRGLMVHTTDGSLGELQDFCFHVLKGLAPSGGGVWRKGQVMGLRKETGSWHLSHPQFCASDNFDWIQTRSRTQVIKSYFWLAENRCETHSIHTCDSYLESSEKAGQTDLGHLGVGEHCSYSPRYQKFCSLFFMWPDAFLLTLQVSQKDLQ